MPKIYDNPKCNACEHQKSNEDDCDACQMPNTCTAFTKDRFTST